MKKGLMLGAVAVVVAGALIAPKFIGQNVHQQVQEQVAKLNEQAGYQASIKQWQQGWFSTQAQIDVHFDMAELDPASAQDLPEFPPLNIQLDIQHGPVLLSSQGLLGLASWQADISGEALRKNLTWTDDLPLYRLSGLTGLFGDHRFTDQIPAFSTAPQPGTTFTFSGYQGSGEIGQSHVQYAGHAASLSGNKGDERRLTVKDLRIQMDADVDMATMMEGGFYDSQTHIGLGEILFDIPGLGSKQAKLNGLAVNVGTKRNAEKGTGEMLVAYLADAVDVGEYQASELALEVQLQNLNEDVLIEYQQMAKSGSFADPEAMLDYLEEVLPILLQDNPALNLSKISVTLPMGKINGYINSQVVNVADMDGSEWMYKEFWLAHVAVDAKIDADREALLFIAEQHMLKQMQPTIAAGQLDQMQAEQMAQQQAPQLLDMLMQQGLMVETQKGLQSTFTLKDGEGLLNGEPVPLPL
ncbi:YdgA family protein [Bowmanella denitrificans]|uniref:YdgA family protein n=1 Tax=Bowmanella denitrificans TaxID=366582 RepID=UPI0011AF7DDF|nr:DUF945 family protein [Bowmanella denitrificans]